jgi:hypothetical protein
MTLLQIVTMQGKTGSKTLPKYLIHNQNMHTSEAHFTLEHIMKVQRVGEWG